jgi:hypothetical protein
MLARLKEVSSKGRDDELTLSPANPEAWNMMSKHADEKIKEDYLQNEGSDMMIARFSKECGAVWRPIRRFVSTKPLEYVTGTYHSTLLK